MKNKNITKKLIPVLMAFTLILTVFTAKAETESSPNSVDVTVPGTQIIKTVTVSYPYTLKPGKQPETFAVYDADGKQIGIGAAFALATGEGGYSVGEKYIFYHGDGVLARFDFNATTEREKDELEDTIRNSVDISVRKSRTTKSKGWTYGPCPL